MEPMKPLRIIAYDHEISSGHSIILFNPNTFQKDSPMRFTSEKERNRPFVNLKFRQHDAIDSYDAEAEDVKNFLGFEVKDEP